VSSQQTLARRRVEAALAGDADLNTLSAEEGVVFNAEIAAAVEEHLASSHYGDRLAAQGITTVSMNSAGQLVEHRPDGTSVILDESPA